MKKGTYYFSHDFGARNDPKIQRLIVELGAAALGAYWCIIEQLYEKGGRMALECIKDIAVSLNVNIELVKSVLCDYDLFEIYENEFWSKEIRIHTK